MKRAILMCVGVLAASSCPSVASAYYPYYLPHTGMYNVGPYGGGIYGYIPTYGVSPYYGAAYGSSWGAGMSVPYSYGYSYGPVIVNNNLPRTRSRYEEYAGPPARSRSSLYPAVTYSEFAAYEQRSSAEATTDGNRATIIVRLPANNAKLEINGQAMTQSGTERTFVTPVLASPSKAYTFDLKVSWTDELGSRTQAATISVRAGQTHVESFPQQAKQN